MVRPPPIVRTPTGAEIAHFRQYGFVRLRNILAEEEVAHLHRAMMLAQETFELSSECCNLTELADAMEFEGAGHAGAVGGGLAQALRQAGARPLRERPVAGLPAGR